MKLTEQELNLHPLLGRQVLLSEKALKEDNPVLTEEIGAERVGTVLACISYPDRYWLVVVWQGLEHNRLHSEESLLRLPVI